MEAVLALGLSKISSAIYSNIQDCDEVFNYFEPLHFYQYHLGFQTWEYVYRLRSWFYLVLHAIPYPDKLVQFYLLRGWIALWSLISSIYFYRKLASKNKEIASYFVLFNLAPGMFISSSAFLPSTFGMIFLTFAYANSLEMDSYSIVGTIACTSIAGIWGWPFCLFYGLIYVIQKLLERKLMKRLWFMVVVGTLAIVITSIPVIWYDSSIYREITVAPYNLVKYNMFSEAGPELYGTESWKFYFLNGILNFNLGFAFALLSLPLLVLDLVTTRAFSGWIVPSLSFYFWIGVFTFQPHKEERFMYVAFPLICMNAAVGYTVSKRILETALLQIKMVRKWSKILLKLYRFAVVSTFVGLSIIRIYSQYEFYHAPIKVYAQLANYQPISTIRIQNVCVGKEWYRFPSHYFVPFGMKVSFIPSRFNGLLPTHFVQPEIQSSSFQNWSEYALFLQKMPRNFTSVPSKINDMNQHEDDRYVSFVD